jgi:exonuclease SbcC
VIPRKLRLRNFLSYRSCDLDFAGLSVAVLSGRNGDGKSALLDAMTWAVWGEARGRVEDDRIFLGEPEMLVEFEFEAGGDIYQVMRKRLRGKSAGELHLFVRDDGERHSLTGGTMSETQAEIIRRVGMDFDTFANSAFVAQGRAGEFTARRPAERKEIFRKVLGLELYEELAGRANDRRKESAAELKSLRLLLDDTARRLQALPGVKERLAGVQIEAAAGEADVALLEERTAQLRVIAMEYDRLALAATRADAELRRIEAASAADEASLTRLRDDLAAAERLLDAAAEVEAAHARVESLREEERALTAQQTEAHRLEVGLKEAEGEVLAEQRRLEAALAGLDERVALARRAAEGLPGLRASEAALEREAADLARTDEALAAIRDEIAALGQARASAETEARAC